MESSKPGAKSAAQKKATLVCFAVKEEAAPFLKLAKNNPRAILHAAHDDPFDPDHWWRNTRDVLSVVRESLGLLNAWAGLPVPPHSN